jgi:diaminopimelate epimerase
MTALPFVKMHGLGNDFVVIDTRRHELALDDAKARAICDRRTGIGCDQLILLERPQDPTADIFMRIRNADGGEVAACGNATRCVAALVLGEVPNPHVVVETAAGLLDARPAGECRIAVDMGEARIGWQEIPLAREVDTLHVPLQIGLLSDPVCTSMGNPHATFFVPEVGIVALDRLGPVLEHDALFPERANIGIAEIRGRERMRLRVWERGAGITQACGTGACAAVVAASRRGLTERRVEVVVDGGSLEIEWLPNGHVLMTGPAATSFTGTFDPDTLT